MSRKNLARLIGAALALAGSNAVLACSTNAWTTTGSGGADVGAVVGAPIANEPDEVTAANDTPRYSGRCGLKATAPNNYVRDASPNAESTYRARFYVRAGVTGGEAIVFRAATGNTPGTTRFTVGVDNDSINIDTDTAAPVSIAAVSNGWYSVELTFTGSGTPSLAYTVAGNTGAVAGAPTPVTGNLTAGAGVIDHAELGWISGAATGQVAVDAFESRRTTAIGRLRRGDAGSSGGSTPDGVCNANDVTATARDITSVLLNGAGGTLSSGQPDCNEDGLMNANDVTCIAKVVVGDLLSPAGAKTVCGAPQ